MQKKWNLSLNNQIWVEFWDEIPNSTICLKFGINKHNELLNNEIRILPSQPKPDTNKKYMRKPGTDMTNSNSTQLKTIDIRKINLLKLRQRSLNIIFDFQNLNPLEFNKVTIKVTIKSSFLVRVKDLIRKDGCGLSLKTNGWQW